MLVMAGLSMPSRLPAAAHLVIQSAERERWYGEDNLYGENYGRRMAMDGNRMVVAGEFKAVVWEHDGGAWRAVQVLDPSLPRIEDVAIHGDWIVFGSPLDLYGLAPPVDGYVSVFRYETGTGWHEVATWDQTAADQGVPDYEIHSFGSSVDICGDILVVSAPDSRETDTPYGDGPGFVFIYEYSAWNWNLIGWFSSSNSDPWRFFGASIDLEDNWLIVGAPRDDDHAGPGEYGAAFIYEGIKSVVDGDWSWHHRRTIGPISTPDPLIDNDFARHVANDGGERFIVVADFGAKVIERDPWQEQVVNLPGSRTSRTTDGVDFDNLVALYVDSANDQVVSILPQNNVWAEGAVLSASSLTTFPMGVAIRGGRAAVGYPVEGVAGPNTGCVVAYGNSPLLLEDQVLCYGDAEPDDGFGLALAAENTGGGNAMALVGAPNDAGGIGAVYRYAYSATADEWTKIARWQPGVHGMDAATHFGTAVAFNGLGGRAASALSVFGRGVVFVDHPGDAEVQLNSPANDDGFGHSLAYVGDVLIAGAPRSWDDALTMRLGAVYAYEYDAATGWGGTSQRLVAPNLTNQAQFGSALACNDQWLVIGAPGDQRDGVGSGAAYVCARDGSQWGSPQRLDPGGIAAGDRYGHAVAVYDNTLLVSAPGNGGTAGAVYRFTWDGSSWNFQEIMTAADAQTDGGFGSSLYLDHVNLFVGAPRADAGPADTGAIYAYRLSNGIWTAAVNRIDPIGPVADDRAGHRVAFVNDMLLTGAPGVNDAGTDAGAVIAFDYKAFIEVPSPLDPSGPGCQGDFEIDFEQTFLSFLNPARVDYFGQALDVSGDAMIISEPWADFSYVDSQGNPVTSRLGAVHVYRRTGIDHWILEQTIQPPAEDVTPILNISLFGQTAAIDGDWLAIGNWYGRMVHVYRHTPAGWVLHSRLLPFEAVSQNSMGRYGLDISGDTIMVGEDNYIIPSVMNAVGRVYFFEYNSATDSWGLNGGAPILSSEYHLGQNFGHSVAVDEVAGRAVATGDNQWDLYKTYRSAYVFTRSGGLWQETAILQGNPHNATQFFGWEALGISGDTIVVGDAGYPSFGGVFVWTHDGSAWTGPDILSGSQPGFQDYFGDSVAIDEDLIVVGATSGYDHYPGGARPGIAYVFGRDSGVWVERLRIVPPDLSLYQFGIQTAVSDGIVAAGAPRGDNTANGIVYAYDMGCQGYCPGDFDHDGDVDGSDLAVIAAETGTTGCGAASPCQADLDGNGVVDQIDMNTFLAKFGRTNCQ
jgi:hypothetical protein